MSSLKFPKQKVSISVHLTDLNLSKKGAIFIPKIQENEKTLSECDLFDKDYLSNDAKEVKSFKKTRKSVLASTSRRNYLEALDVASVDSWENCSNTNENKKAGKKIDLQKKRTSRRSTLAGKSKITSTALLLSDGKSLDLKENIVENEVNVWNNKPDKKPCLVLKKKKVTNKVQEKDRSIDDFEIKKNDSNMDAITEYSNDREKKNNKMVSNSKFIKLFKQENTEPKRKENEQKKHRRRSIRIAGMEKISYKE